jgi:hypothetical protein
MDGYQGGARQVENSLSFMSNCNPQYNLQIACAKKANMEVAMTAPAILLRRFKTSRKNQLNP